MRKIAIAVSSLFAFSLLGAPHAVAATQYVVVANLSDSSDQSIMIPGLDIESVQVQASSAMTTRVITKTKGPLDIEALNAGKALIVLQIETTGDDTEEYFFLSTKSVLSKDYFSTISFYDMKSSNEDNIGVCQSTAGFLAANQYAVEFPNSCIGNLVSYRIRAITVNVAQNENPPVLDFLPEQNKWSPVKSSFMDQFPCNKAKKDSKVTYGDTQYICAQVSGKYKFVDYGPIAAAKSKYLTEKAYYLCKLSTNTQGAILSDKGKTLILGGGGNSQSNLVAYLCVASIMGLPSSISSQISMTRALDGIQRAKWKQISLVWNYHPDNGLGITFSYN